MKYFRKSNGFRILVMVISVLLIMMGMSISAFAETRPSPSQSFSDLDLNAWYIAGTDFVIDKGIMNGVGGDRFAPNETTTRAMIVTMLYRVEGEPAIGSEQYFDDVKPDDWYFASVTWAGANEIVNGTAESVFSPGDPITREQFATILYRYHELKAGSKEQEAGSSKPEALSAYTDIDRISDWAKESMLWAVNQGIITGKTENTLDPKGPATRAEVATMLQRFLDKEEAMETEAVYLGVKDYGASETNKDNKDNFLYRFEVNGAEKILKIDNGTEDENGKYDYPIQNQLKEGYRYQITIDDDTVTAVREIPGEAISYTPPISGIPGTLTLKNFLQTGLGPVGTTLYIYGGGWDWQDEGSSIQTRTLGVSPDWVKFFNENDVDYTYKEKDNDPAKADPLTSYYPYGGYNEYYYAGLDCSGFVGWTVYNTFETKDGEPGYVGGSTGFAKRLAAKGWGEWAQDNTGLKPGDVISIKGHVWISLGTCSDGSIVLLHCTPARSRTNQPGGGVELSAIGTDKDCEAYKLADQYMSKYYPTWYERYPIYLCDPKVYLTFEGENAGRFRWNPDAEAGLKDPEGIQTMTPAEALKELFSEE